MSDDDMLRPFRGVDGARVREDDEQHFRDAGWPTTAAAELAELHQDLTPRREAAQQEHAARLRAEARARRWFERNAR